MQNLVQRVVQRLVVGMMVDAPITTAVLAWGGGLCNELLHRRRSGKRRYTKKLRCLGTLPTKCKLQVTDT